MPRLTKREQEGDFQTSLLTNAQLPRYLEPTFSLTVGAVAPTNYAERDRVRNSFSSSACWGIRGLPQYLKAGAVNDSRRRKVVTNLSSLPLFALQPLAAPELVKEIDLDPAGIQGLQTLKKGIFGDPTSSLGTKPPMKGTGTGAGLDRITFGKTPRYMGTMYGREKEVHRQQDEQQKMLAESFSRPSFSVSAKLFVHPAVGFVDPEFGPGFKPQWDALKRKDVDSTFLAGPFSKCVPSRGLLPMKSNARKWCRQLYSLLASDWPDLHFTLRITKEELLVQFPTTQQELPPQGAVQRYMAHLAAHGDAMTIGLQKRGDRWAVLETQDEEPAPAPLALAEKGKEATGNASSEEEEQTDDDEEDDEVKDAFNPAQTKKQQEQYLTFSFYFPWITVGRLTVQRKASRSERNKARQKQEEDCDPLERRIDEIVEKENEERRQELIRKSREKGKRESARFNPSVDLLAALRR